MLIAGFQKQSLIDYPGNIASIVFTAGCNFRCKYCHNPELVLPELIKRTTPIPEDYLFDYFNKNSKLLDAVVITGGEPTLHPDLKDFIKKVKDIGLKVKLDTNGTNPKVIKELLNDNLLDYIAMDIKAPVNLEKYTNIVGEVIDVDCIGNVCASVEIVEKSSISHEFRTTVVKGMHLEQDIISIAGMGIKRLVLQNFSLNVIIDKDLNSINTFRIEEIENIVGNISGKYPNLDISIRS
jgi:pyruvate formate lyase activating enzyme